MSLDVESHAHAHGHKTGHRWVDMVVAFSALFVSLVSLGVAILHGRTMETMAEANARLVSANSWPFLAYGAGTTTVDGAHLVDLHVGNRGVGPAKIESVELVWKGVAYRSNRDFLEACCGLNPASGAAFDVDLLPYEVLRGGETIHFLQFRQSADPAVFAALQRAMLSRDLQLNTCYCSIFDDCWKANLIRLSLTPQKVGSCVPAKVPFDQRALDGPG